MRVLFFYFTLLGAMAIMGVLLCMCGLLTTGCIDNWLLEDNKHFIIDDNMVERVKRHSTSTVMSEMRLAENVSAIKKGGQKDRDKKATGFSHRWECSSSGHYGG